MQTVVHLLPDHSLRHIITLYLYLRCSNSIHSVEATVFRWCSEKGEQLILLIRCKESVWEEVKGGEVFTVCKASFESKI